MSGSSQVLRPVLAAVAIAAVFSPAILRAQPKPRPGDDARPSKAKPARVPTRGGVASDESAGPVKAPSTPARLVHHLSVDGVGAFPVGDWSEAAGVGVGAGLRYEFDFDSPWDFVAELAYVYHFENEIRTQTDAGFSQTVTEMLVLAGVTYDIPMANPNDRLFVLAMAGLNWISVETAVKDALVAQDSVTDQEWSLLLGGGYGFGPYSVRAGLLISAIGRSTRAQLANEGPLADYTGTMGAAGMFGYHFYAF